MELHSETLKLTDHEGSVFVQSQQRDLPALHDGNGMLERAYQQSLLIPM
jgi:hypothetical protein